jgi:DNA modification methylase
MTKKPYKLLVGRAEDRLAEFEPGSVDCIVTSPPYFFKRDYGHVDQIGLEGTPEAFIDALVNVFDLCLRALADDGTCWVNLGDAYSNRNFVRRSSHQGMHGEKGARESWKDLRAAGLARMSSENTFGGRAVPEKSLMLLPDRLAIAMTDRGWILRNRLTWLKSFSLPDPATDRLPLNSEPILFFTKSKRYHFDRKSATEQSDVWKFPPSAGSDGHQATFNPELARRCIAVGCKPGGLVLDPFSGAASTGVAAIESGRRYVGIDISEEYTGIAKKRLKAAIR